MPLKNFQSKLKLLKEQVNKMKSKDTLKELREKSVLELNETVLENKKQLLELRLQKGTQKLENTAAIRNAKRTIAQAKTVIAEKEGKQNA